MRLTKWQRGEEAIAQQGDSLPEEGAFDQSLKGTKEQARGQLGSVPGGGTARGHRHKVSKLTLQQAVWPGNSWGKGKGPRQGQEAGRGQMLQAEWLL